MSMALLLSLNLTKQTLVSQWSCFSACTVQDGGGQEGEGRGEGQGGGGGSSYDEKQKDLGQNLSFPFCNISVPPGSHERVNLENQKLTLHPGLSCCMPGTNYNK